MQPLVAVIAPGAMGAGVGARLVQNGLKVVTSLEGRSAGSTKRAASAGMTPASDAEVATADFILSIVPPGEALKLAERLLPVLRAANRKPIYVECNAINPETVKRIAGVIAAAGCPFVDAGIIGGPPRAGTPGPGFFLSGPEAKRVAVLGDYGLRVSVMEGSIGDASALKMCYGGLNKGLIALGSALVLAADRAGVGEAFRAELGASQAPVLAQLTRGVPDLFPKAYRWVAEFEELAQFVGPSPEGQMFENIARLYERLAADQAGSKQETAALGRFFAAANPAKGPKG